jgi:hypothetical protein
MADKISYYLVLDANNLVRDFWMSGWSFSYLLTRQFLGHRPVIPDVAYREARNQLKLRAEMLLSNRVPDGSGSPGNTARLLRLFNYKRAPQRGKWNIEQLLKRWERHVKGILKRYDGLVLSTPRIELDEMTRRSIDRQKPFSKGDRGFRDTLVWLSTLELVAPESCVSFITGNTEDFFSDNSAEPHPDIFAEAEKKLSRHRRMLFHRSLDEFITRFDSDRSASSEALQRALISNTLSGFDLWEWLEANLVTVLDDRDKLDMVRWAGVPDSAEAPLLHDIEGLVALDIRRVRHVEDDTYRIYCDLAFIGHFDCDIAFSGVETVVHPNQILWKDETDSSWTRISLRAAGTLIVAVDFDVKRREVVTCFASPLCHWSSYDAAIEHLEEVCGEVDRVR